MKVLKRFFLPFLAFSLSYGSNFSYGVKAFKQKDYVTAKKYFELALEKDKVKNANYFLGIIYLNGYVTKKDLKKAEKYLLNAVNYGNIRAKCYLGELYIIKYNNIANAKKLLKEGFEGGATECMQIAKKYNLNL